MYFVVGAGGVVWSLRVRGSYLYSLASFHLCIAYEPGTLLGAGVTFFFNTGPLSASFKMRTFLDVKGNQQDADHPEGSFMSK